MKDDAKVRKKSDFRHHEVDLFVFALWKRGKSNLRASERAEWL